MAHIFLDFDRTLFDTNRFYHEHEHFLFESVQKPDFTDNFARFLYDDVLYFLKWCQGSGHHCYLLMFGSREVQEPKFQLCNIAEYFTETFYVEQGSKVDAVYQYVRGITKDKIIFIDDTISHLEVFHVKLPQSVCFLMQRGEEISKSTKNNQFSSITALSDAKKYLIDRHMP